MTEFEFLVACTHSAIEKCPTGKIRRYISQNEDLGTVSFLANYHGVAPLFYHNLKQVGWDLLKPEFREHIDQYFQVSRRHNLFQSKEFTRIVSFLSENDIPSLVIKGQALATQTYGDSSLRRTTDIDLLIPEEKFGKVEDLIVEDGYDYYQKVKNLTGLKKRTYSWLSKQYPFKRHSGVFMLDLHTGIMPPGYHYPGTFDSLYQKSVTVNIGGEEIATLGLPDQLLMLSFHGIKNRWETLKYVCDVSAVVQMMTEAHWKRVLSLAIEYRCDRILFIALLLAYKIYGAILPEQVLQKMWNDPKVSKITSDVQEVISTRHTGRRFSYFERVWFHLNSREALRDKLRYVGYSLLVNMWSALFRQTSIERT